MRKITKIDTSVPTIKRKKRVAAYARVSANTERSMHSLSAQVSYYNNLIQKNPEWEFAGVYTDKAITGTMVGRREEFQRLVEDCEAGKIDIVITKSVSRFARNTVDLLETVRRFKELGIEVRFEKEHINTLTADGELMLTILASYAQEEVQTMSENIKWSIKKQFEKGRLNGCCSFLGYKWYNKEKKLIVVSEEAEIVKRIFKMYQSGCSLKEIQDTLLGEGLKGVRGGKWDKTNLLVILRNITYTGNLLLQKTYSQDPITKKARWNKGELPQYYSENTHEAIIDMDTFQAVQKRLAYMKEAGNSVCYEVRPFSRKLICSECGSHYMRGRTQKKNGKRYYYWKCWKHKYYGGKECDGRMISENKLIAYSCDALGWESFNGDRFRELIEKVIVKEDRLEFYFYNGKRKDIADVKRNHYTGKKKNKSK